MAPTVAEVTPGTVHPAALRPPQGLVGALARRVQQRVPLADLNERDPDYIRRTLPGLWLLASRTRLPAPLRHGRRSARERGSRA